MKNGYSTMFHFPENLYPEFDFLKNISYNNPRVINLLERKKRGRKKREKEKEKGGSMKSGILRRGKRDT